MKLVLIEHDGLVEPGVLVADDVVPIGGLVAAQGDGQAMMESLIDGFDALRPRLEVAATDGARRPLGEVDLLAPLPRPRTILCAIGNYWEHAQRDPAPLRMFLKNPDAVIGPGDTIHLPATTEPWVFMHEAELAIVIRGPGRIFGYTGLIDVSARGEGRTSWGRYSWLGKSFDTFCPIGPCIVTADEVEDPNALDVRFWNDGELRHDYNTDDMEHRVPELVSWASAQVPLATGDVIACGTNHEGLGPLQDGEEVTLEVAGIGSMRVGVRDPLGRRWERGVYMGRDSTHHEARARHGDPVTPRADTRGRSR